MKIKYFLITTVLAIAVLFSGSAVSAQTTDMQALLLQIQEQINWIFEQIKILQVQLFGSSSDSADVSFSAGEAGIVQEAQIAPEPTSILSTDCFHLYEKLTESYNKSCGDEAYSPVADINKDGTVNLLDMGLYSENEKNQEWCQQRLSETESPCALVNVARSPGQVQEAIIEEPVVEYVSILETPCFYLYEKLVPGYNKSCGDELYSPVADINKDGTVNLLDMGLYSENPENQAWCQERLTETTSPCEPAEPLIIEETSTPISILSTDCFHLYEKLTESYNKSCGDEAYSPVADINKDGTVNLLDMGFYSENPENQAWCQERLTETTSPCAL
ncbi:MAG: hypothetical protein A2998_02330 [Candidatus Staskawiczbacteria bacterium RIFCSPLOWO2_01_FULL_37_25b]|uniref:Dockerin domain-containing protein n=1 Tax=Candidatus Staskawiczbacteria bacterium RIFCSPLOWO2_01_FULL_37_25b TaxID=1802213 RepID=A0A1G2IH93_9BACT|nr:MAG: hypothetical protein A2998_02330 [Candidatus Staskawiczbacteria bacterium RIFCSPLOWO2_01_FULL_37_25b]